jgi:SPP1 family predicted phage head-tail adaptor
VNVNLNRRISIDQAVPGQDSAGASAPTWTLLATVWAERRDGLPSRSESVRQGLEQARDQVRYRIRYRDDLDSSMRIRDGGDVLQIVGGPAEIGRREYLEFMCERYSTSGST